MPFAVWFISAIEFIYRLSQDTEVELVKMPTLLYVTKKRYSY